MTQYSVGNFVLFHAGEFSSLPDTHVPASIRQAVQDAIADDAAEPFTESFLAKAGFVNIESYGCASEMIEVYSLGGLWYVEQFNETGCFARIVIKCLPDFMTFQAKYLAPVATKIMEKGFWTDWFKANKAAIAEAEKESVH